MPSHDRHQSPRHTRRAGRLVLAILIVAAMSAVGTGTAAASSAVVAGGNAFGSRPDQLSSPYGVAVDAAGNIFVADTGNRRVQMWAAGATSGTTVAGGGEGSASLSFPIDVALDRWGNRYVVDTGRNEVVMWRPGARTGVRVAGSTSPYRTHPSSLDSPRGIAIDSASNLYVADFGNNRVQRWAPGATHGVTVAGNGVWGSGPQQLGNPSAVAIDPAGNVYVADQQNHRVQRWAPGATRGVTVAGGNGSGAAANQLRLPQGVAVDAQGRVFVSDTANRRIQRWDPGAASGVTVASSLYSPSGLDIQGNYLYVAERGAAQVRRIQIALPQITVPIEPCFVIAGRCASLPPFQF